MQKIVAYRPFSSILGVWGEIVMHEAYKLSTELSGGSGLIYVYKSVANML